MSSIVTCDCGTEIELNAQSEVDHYVWALRPDGSRSNLGWCPRKDGGFHGAIRRIRTTHPGQGYDRPWWSPKCAADNGIDPAILPSAFASL